MAKQRRPNGGSPDIPGDPPSGDVPDPAPDDSWFTDVAKPAPATGRRRDAA